MRIDTNNTIDNPTVLLQYHFSISGQLLVFANYKNDKNSFIRNIGKFVYTNEWKFEQNEVNTDDVKEYFKNLKIEDLNIENLEYYQPPKMSNQGVIIPEKYQWVFPDNKFILEGFEIPLIETSKGKVVDVAYFQWQAFRDCLDNGKHEDLKRNLMGVWEYVSMQEYLGNTIDIIWD